MRILIGTPAAGGMVTTQWLLSFIQTFSEATKKVYSQNVLVHLEAAFRASMANDKPLVVNDFIQKVMGMPKLGYVPDYDVGVYTMANESLIGRGRNHIAQVALKQGWDKLFFIDADAGWSWEQFKAIVDSPSPIIAGACPLKIYPINLNYFPKQEDIERFHPDGFKTPETFFRMRDHYIEAQQGNPEVEVDFIGTAFMCIHRSALLKLAETADSYKYPNPANGEQCTHWDFFKTCAVDGKFMSEDWGFCHMARQNGIPVKMNMNVIITHTGTHTFVSPTYDQVKQHAVTMAEMNRIQQELADQAKQPGSSEPISATPTIKSAVDPVQEPKPMNRQQRRHAHKKHSQIEVKDDSGPKQTPTL